MKNIMVQATGSSAGKSIITTGLCRIFKEDGHRVAPFKSQNMSSKSYLDKDGKEMSIAQAIQSYASGLDPRIEMNPILLKPRTNSGSDLYLMGENKGPMAAKDYFTYRKTLMPEVVKSYESLGSLADLIVIEGAGSPAEINLRENDIVNMGLAEALDAPVILIADIDRGGVFASLYGTVKLLREEERSRVKGLVINKFRGDLDLLLPGIKMIEDLLSIPVIGVIPFMEIKIADEDSIFIREKTLANREELEKDFDHISKIIRESLDMDKLYEIIGIENES